MGGLPLRPSLLFLEGVVKRRVPEPGEERSNISMASSNPQYILEGEGVRWEGGKSGRKVLLCRGVECEGVGCYVAFAVVDNPVGCTELWER